MSEAHSDADSSNVDYTKIEGFDLHCHVNSHSAARCSKEQGSHETNPACRRMAGSNQPLMATSLTNVDGGFNPGRILVVELILFLQTGQSVTKSKVPSEAHRAQKQRWPHGWQTATRSPSKHTKQTFF
eukprot:UN0899